MTVSWVATASSSNVESNARRVLPLQHPGRVDHVADRVEDPLRPIHSPAAGSANTSAPIVMPSSSSAKPAATFHRYRFRNACAASRSDRPSSACNTITVAITSAGHRRPTPPRREQIREQLVGEQLLAMLSQERVHRVVRHQMAAQRRRVQQLPVRIARPCIPPFFSIPTKTRAPRRISSTVS